MRNEFSPFGFAAGALCVLSLFSFRAYAQDRDKDHKDEHPNGIVQDWSLHHVVYPRVGPIESLIAVQHDDRAILSWQEAEREDWHRARDRDLDRDHRPSHGTQGDLYLDWSISLGSGTTALAMYPAKYTFNINATPNCTTDFIVFPVNAVGLSAIAATGTVTSGSATINITAGAITPPYVGKGITGVGIPAGDTIAAITGNPASSLTLAVAATAGTGIAEALTVSGQPNIVGFNNLYSGTAGGTGVCNAGRTAGPTDDGVSATTIWSYNITAAGGVVATSPALSLDGTKIAFVETGAGAAQFHVLAPKTGDGVATNLQTVTSPLSITSGFAAVAPAAGQATNLVLGSANDTLSSPFVDYDADAAYVGNDAGVLFRIINVFCARTACTGGGSPAPSLDSTWGTGGAVTIGGTCTGSSGKLTGPVAARGNVFVGCSDGKLYGFSTTTGSPIAGSPLTVGSTGSFGGIVDPPLVDLVNGFVYVVAGNSSGTGTPSVLVQASTASFTTPTPVVATLGAGGQFNLHAPSFNEAYFSSPISSVGNVQGSTGGGVTSRGTTSNWQIYEWADSGVGGPATLYGVGFTNNLHVMTAGPASNFLQVTGSAGVEFSPLTTILNGSVDQLYMSGLTTLTPNFIEYNLTDFAGLFPNVLFPINGTSSVGGSRGEGHGTTGIVVDNVSPDVQASSVYFGIPSLNTAVKLTQSALQ